MIKFLKRLWSSEKGQALPIVLVLLAIGSLTIAVSLNYATTSLKGSEIVEKKTEGIYAAGAGVERALWSLGGGGTPPTQLSENISGMAVGIETQNKGTFTLYFGELINVDAVHSDWLDVTGNITALGGDVYRYTITVIWQPGSGLPGIKLEEVGARLPIGYTYQVGSADIVGNLSRNDPPLPIPTDTYGAYLLRWNLGTPRPEVSSSQPTRTQSFNIIGTGSTSGHYANVLAQPDAIGPVGEITGTRYKITATATRPADGKIAAEVVTETMIQDDGTINILSWQITK